MYDTKPTAEKITSKQMQVHDIIPQFQGHK